MFCLNKTLYLTDDVDFKTVYNILWVLDKITRYKSRSGESHDFSNSHLCHSLFAVPVTNVSKCLQQRSFRPRNNQARFHTSGLA